MPETFPAILKGDRLEWLGAVPGPDLRDRAVAVEVTIVPTSPVEPIGDAERRRRIIESLGRIAARGTFSPIDDAVAWQREVRRDRPLPGREP